MAKGPGGIPAGRRAGARAVEADRWAVLSTGRTRPAATFSISASAECDSLQCDVGRRQLRLTLLMEGEFTVIDAKTWHQQLAAARDTTRDLVQSVVRDEWPRNGAIVDFGIDSQKHYEALYHPIREREIEPKQLDEALGDGDKLSELARRSAGRPAQGCRIPHGPGTKCLAVSQSVTAPKKTAGGIRIEGPGGTRAGEEPEPERE